MNPNSHNSNLASFAVGERRYYETTKTRYISDMRTLNAPATRRPDAIRAWEFSSNLFTAVGTRGEIRYLLCLERIT